MCRNWQTRQTQNLLSARVCGFESHHRHQTLTARKPLIYRGLRAFLYALYSYVVSLAHQQITLFRLIFGGTLSIMRRDIRLKLHWQTQPLRRNSNACKCLRWSKYRCDLTTPEFLSGLHRLHTKGLRSYDANRGNEFSAYRSFAGSTEKFCVI